MNSSKKSFFKKIVLVFVILIINLICRIYLSNITQPRGDILVHQEWSRFLYKDGLSGSYFFQGWTYTPPTQPPLMMVAYYFSQSFYQNRNIFSYLHNITKIPPAFILLGFQEYGEILSLKFWELMATYIVATIFLLYFSRKYNFTKAITIFLLIIFNPITIFINAIWGQNDILPTLFMYSSFLLVFSKLIIISPIVFLIGILFKPTTAIIGILFTFVFLFHHFRSKSPHKIIKYIILSLSGLLIIFLSFKSFIPNQIQPIDYINDIIHHRISTSSKGSKIASVSAFNLYSLFLNIDQTRAVDTNLIIQPYLLGILLFIFINIIFIKKTLNSKNDFIHILFPIYFISEGSFLFMTNMLERYFIPAFLASVIISIIYIKRFGFLMFGQQLIWFLNLIYAFYYRTNGSINTFFRGNNFLTIRILSLINIVIYLMSFKNYLHLLKNKNSEN